MPLARISFLLCSIFSSVLNILSRPAANLPRVTNILMSQFNAVFSSTWKSGRLVDVIATNQLLLCSFSILLPVLPGPDFALIYTQVLLLRSDLQ